MHPVSLGFRALFIFFIFHVAIWRLKKGFGVIAMVAVAFFSYLIVVMFNAVYVGSLFSEHVWVSCPMFMFFVMLYMHFYVGIDRSVSIRILGELVKAKDNKLSLEELQILYPKEEMFESRVNLLVAKKWLLRKDGSFSCAAKGKYMAHLAIYLKKLYSLKETG